MIIKQIVNFTKAIIQHIRYGMKKSSHGDIHTRYSICYTCPSVSPQKDQCLECGCYISKEKKFLNKLAWKDQKCPLNKW
jgi:hypothetical protein